MLEEIDGILYLNEDRGIFKQFEKTIFLEAKNHSQKVDKNDLIQFSHKVRKRSCKFGLIFSCSGYTKSFFQERNEILLMDKIKILLFDLSDLERISNGTWPSKLLAEKFQVFLKMGRDK